ncbi:MAG TPA: energy transducer TonB, partial [Bacteroidetes bacterium]|nr:energy transducer TonB [Bacteroidota bacterium]
LFSGCNIDSMSLAEKRKCSDEKLLKYVYERFKWPPGFCGSGRVVVCFEIEKDGTVGNCDILRDIGGRVGDQVLSIIKTMPKWTPGMKNGKPVKVEFNLPIRICLE